MPRSSTADPKIAEQPANKIMLRKYDEAQHTERPLDPDSDLYIVPNRNGPGKTVIRRHHPPPTTVALDEDFDAATIEDTSTIYGGEGSRYARRDLDSAVGCADNINARRETDNADSPDCGNLASNTDQSESALSDLNLGIGKALSTGMQSAPRMSGQAANQARVTHKDEDITRDCVAGDGEGSPRASASGGTGVQKSEMIQERVLEVGKGRPVTMWNEQTASVGKLNGTQISYEEFSAGDTFVKMSGPTSHSRRKESNRDLLKIKDEEKDDGSKWKGKDVEAARSLRHSEGRKNPRSFWASPAHTPRSERMYSAAELGVPPPPSEYSLSEFASANIPGSSRTKTDKEVQNQDQSRTSTLIKARPLANRHSNSSTDSAKATSVTWLDDFLCSFQPSLVHIASILTSLGIRHEDHFRAVVRLSEETRDREVRDVALQKGMTVVEWAMLLDRIRSL